jgi:hypothetical protein
MEVRMSALFPPIRPIELPRPIDAMREQLVHYSPVAEQRRIEAAAKKFFDDFFLGRVHSAKMEYLLWYLISYTLEAYRLWFLYMVVLSNTPPAGDSSSSNAPPLRPMGINGEAASNMGLAAFGGNRPLALRHRLEEAGRSLKNLAREGERSLPTAERHLGAYNRSVQALREIVMEAFGLVDNFHRLKNDPNPERATTAIEDLHRRLVKALDKVRTLVGELEAKHQGSSKKSAERLDPLLAGAIELQPNVYGVLDRNLRTALNERHAGLGDVFEDALGRGAIPVYGLGDTGVKMKAKPEIKVRRDRLEAFHQEQTMRVRASRPPIQIRLLDGRIITLYTFDEEYDAH